MDRCLFWRAKPERHESSEKDFREENRKLERDLTLKVKACRELEGQINELDSAYKDTKFQLRQASIENKSMVKQHGDRIEALKLEHSKSMSESDENYSHTLDSLIQGHNIELMKLDTNHREEVKRLRAGYGQQVKDLETRHSQEINKLVGQLLDSRANNQGWADDKLKIQFQKLQHLIETLTSPRNKEFDISPNQQLGPQLDPTNFLGRVGRGKFHFLLKSIIWAILQEQFFSAPFGFGALGPGKGKGELLGVYLMWRKSLDEGAGTASPSGDGFAIFHQDELANNWRSANFRCINVVLSGDGKKSLAPHSPLAKLSAENLRQTVNRIMGVLSEVSRLSNSRVRGETEAEVHKLADIACEIAVQFGVHPAQLHLSIPHRGAQIQIGDEFHDCEDGDVDRGMICPVDLVTFPGLARIGDGRSEMSSKQIITPCEIYPNEQHS